jgi:hypothetical protein
MKSAAELRYEIHSLEKDLSDYMPASLRSKMETNLAKKKADLLIARYLTYKADIYGPTGRIYGFEAKFHVSPDAKLYHGTMELDPATLTDGHGRVIITPDD